MDSYSLSWSYCPISLKIVNLQYLGCFRASLVEKVQMTDRNNFFLAHIKGSHIQAWGAWLWRDLYVCYLNLDSPCAYTLNYFFSSKKQQKGEACDAKSINSGYLPKAMFWPVDLSSPRLELPALKHKTPVYAFLFFLRLAFLTWLSSFSQ